MRFDNCLANLQAKSHPGVMARRERQDELRLTLRIQPRTAVLDDNFRHLAVGLATYRDDLSIDTFHGLQRIAR